MTLGLKRILCAMFALCLVVSMLAACGGSSNGDSSTASKNKDNDTDEAISFTTASGYDENKDYYETMPESIKGQTVRFATWIDHTQTEGAKPLNNIFNDIGIHAELFTVPEIGYIDAIVTKIAANDVPDVLKTNGGATNPPLTLQITQPVNRCSSVPMDDPLWDQSMLKTATIDGNIYYLNAIGSPWSGSNLCFYNKALFKENGFKTPSEYYEEGNWTWATFEKVMKDVKALGDDYHGAYFMSWDLVDTAGTGFIKYDYETATYSNNVTDPKLTAAFETWSRWNEAGLLGCKLPTWFKEGKTGMCVTGVYGLKTTGHFVGMDFDDIGFTYLPALSDSIPAKTGSIYRMYGVVAGAPHADAAGWFIRYWLDPRNYDMSSTFISAEAGNFYYELTNADASNKHFNIDEACGGMIGATNARIFSQTVENSSPAQVPTAIAAQSNKVQQAVDASNSFMQSLKDKYK